MIIYQTYTNPQVYTDQTDPRVYGTKYDVDTFDFDEVNKAVAHLVNHYDDFQDHNPPQGYSFEGEFFSECAATTRLSYTHNGDGTFTITPESDSLSCGFVPAAPPTCDLVLSYQLTPTAGGADVLAGQSSAHGAVQYRLDGSPPQLSPRFRGLAPGRHVLTAIDTGVSNCQRSVAFTVLTPPPPVAPAGPPVGVDFTGQPIWYPVAAPAGAEVVLELYAESRHGAGDFRLVMSLRRRANSAGRINFRLDPLLDPLLSAFVPPAVGVRTVRCTTQLVDYFVRTATVPVPDLATFYVLGPRRTALRGALPAEHGDFDYFTYRLEAFGQPPFLTWQPTATKQITVQQPEWLFYLAYTLDAQVVIRRTYASSDVPEPLVVNEVVPMSAGRLVAIPVKPVAGKPDMTLSVESQQGEPLSGLVHYELVPVTERSRYLLFTNSLGGVDTLRTEGRLEAALEATAEQVELPAAAPAAGRGPAPYAQSQPFDVTAQRKLKLATGWLTAAQLASLQELVLSREIWQWENGCLLPLVWKKRQLLYASDTDSLRGMVLEFDYAYAPAAYAALA